MAHITADRVRQTSTSTGTGTIVLSGSLSGFRTFASVLAVSDTFWYAIASFPGSEWEVGLGTYSALNTITRTTVLASSNAGAAVVFSAGDKEVFITAAASKFLQQDSTGSYGNFTAGTITAAQLVSNIATGTAPLTVASTTLVTNLNADLLDGRHLDTLSANLRANRNITGGGTITVDASSNVLWSARFIVISNGYGAHFSTTGYFDIYCPTSGTITGVGGAVNVTATAAGIPLAAWHALYYILPIGSTNISLAANFRVASYISALIIPDEWVLIAIRNSDTGQGVHFNNGYRLEPGESIDTTLYDAKNASTATALQTSRTLWGQGFTGAANVTGNLTSVGDITGTAGVTLTATAGTLALAATGANIITATTNGSERMRIDASGNVGIGTTPTGYRLSVVGSAASSVPLYLNSDATNTYVYSPNPVYIGTTGAHQISFVTNNTEKMSISSTGLLSFNSGYGSTAPAYGCRAWVNFNGTTTGTFPGGTVTVTRTAGSTTCNCTSATAHGLITGNNIYASFSNAFTPPYIPGGSYTVTVTGANTFTFVNAQTAAITTGTLSVSLNNIRGDGNVTTVADEGIGAYLINFTTAMPDTNYAMLATVGMGRNPNSTGDGNDNDHLPFIGEQTVYYAKLYIEDSNDEAADKTFVSVAFFR
jgi:hypothetical protein